MCCVVVWKNPWNVKLTRYHCVIQMFLTIPLEFVWFLYIYGSSGFPLDRAMRLCACEYVVLATIVCTYMLRV